MTRVCEEWFPVGSYLQQKLPGFHMNELLKQQLDILLRNIIYDWDFTIVISGSGEVRVGKSVLAMQIGCYWTYQLWKMHNIVVPFDVDHNFIFLWQDLISKGHELGNKFKFTANIYDEAGESLESVKVLTPETRAVMDYLRECGQYNFLNILVLPEYFRLPAPVAITRSKFLIDVGYTTTEEGLFRRGMFKFYGPAKKKKLYIYGKKELNYKAVACDFIGDFDNVYTVDEKKYKEMKNKAFGLRDNKLQSRKLQLMEAALYCLYRDSAWDYQKISAKINEYTGIYIAWETIRDAIGRVKRRRGEE